MARKMYYTEEEAAAKLGCSTDELSQFVTDEKIRVFKDGLRNVYTGEEVDALAAERGMVSEEPQEPEELELAPAEPEELDLSVVDEEIELTPADTERDVISLSEAAEEPAPADKEDTVLSADGVSIFDDADFEVEGVDPMAQTQISPSLDEQIAMEGVGSGSGLLELTHGMSDDTSLGAEIWDFVGADGDDLVGGEGGEMPAEGGLLGDESLMPPASAPISQAPVQPTFVEATDPSAGMFSGMVAGVAIIVLVVGGISLAAAGGFTPGYLDWLDENMIAMLLGSIVIIGLGALVGFLISKSIADKQAAIRRAGG